jgi:phage baseplate assembly protein W
LGGFVEVIRPHFDFPFSFDLGGRPRVIEQDSYEDIRNCVYLAFLTERGTRQYVPEFGRTDPTFQNMPINQTRLEQEIHASEPRAGLSVTQIIKDLTDTVMAGVDDIGH